VDRCVTAPVEPSTAIQALHFIYILHPHFKHWATNKRDQMSREPDVPLKLAVLNKRSPMKPSSSTQQHHCRSNQCKGLMHLKLGSSARKMEIKD
jgi:hypothetical protein